MTSIVCEYGAERKKRRREGREEEGRGERRGDTASLTLPQWKKLFIQLITIIVILINNDFSNGPNYDKKKSFPQIICILILNFEAFKLRLVF